jgi:poly(glycerol-phosphate) alpha-glucosyltransferase
MTSVGLLTSWVSRNNGGLYDAMRFLAQALDNISNIDIKVFGLEDEKTPEDLAGWGTVPVNACRLRGPKFLAYSPKLVPMLHRAKLDLLHIHGLWTYPSMASLQWSIREKKPYLISTHGMLDPWALQHSRWKKRLVSLLYENAHLDGATCLHALCESEAKAIRDYGIKNPIYVIPNGVILPQESKQVPARWENRVPDTAKVLLYLGRLHPKKGLLNLLYGWRIALAQKKSKINDWYLVIAGWDQNAHENELKIVCKKLGIQNRVIFAGPQFDTDKDAIYSRANAFILPSFSEGVPMVILEAWSYCLPVLMTPQCNLPEGFQAQAAIQVNAHQESIAQGLDTLFSLSNNERKKFGINGQQLVHKRFIWSKVASEINAVYEEWILGGGSPPSCIITD